MAILWLQWLLQVLVRNCERDPGMDQRHRRLHKTLLFLNGAHVVNFFKDRMWEAIDKEWMDCLRKEAVENLLQIPGGVVQDHWPASLKKFIVTLSSLVLPRQQQDLQTVLPGMNMTSLNSVLSTGMNWKKKHEVEVLSAVVDSIATSVGANAIIDVGSGQVLSFHYQHAVVAIDACSHHGRVTDARAEQIKKYYAAQMRDLSFPVAQMILVNARLNKRKHMPYAQHLFVGQPESQTSERNEYGNRSLTVPKTVTCNVMSIDMLKALAATPLHKDNVSLLQSSCNADNGSSLVLAGLHACGDLSVTMLKTFMECKEVKAVVSVGCCYNLLSEEGFNHVGSQCGFPMSCGVISAGISLGKSSRDLACQSAERWKCLENDAGLHNFELHALRAAFQMVLSVYYPEVMSTSPSIGRQGKALRRRQQRVVPNSSLHHKENKCSLSEINSHVTGSCYHKKSTELETDDSFDMMLETTSITNENSSNKATKCERSEFIGNYPLFQKYCLLGLCRLGLEPLKETDIHGIWKQVESFAELIGPYWSLRAAFGPLLETFLLLDRLLFLQEQGSSIEAVMLPIFNPALSPRNVAIIAKKLTQMFTM
ncbi:S-adenosyl-L-methionine-dependent methyltransferases superfamily protein [Prunus dulcis]|uniref:S-adenosyl-L-methionine-dependent methyltransferases superfamily protein n=1 Tax=Prunus dulcis TaxID=3755 RepID=A0A4Y1RC26_PRUDU|nr:S-adenosyl-L-methionine-dependent methyltransferases superfamily protein [Prunus dulcis]